MWGEQFSTWELLGLIEKDLQLLKESATQMSRDVPSRQKDQPALKPKAEPASVFQEEQGY